MTYSVYAMNTQTALVQAALKIAIKHPKFASTVLQVAPKLIALARAVPALPGALIPLAAAPRGAILGAAVGIIVGVSKKESVAAIFARTLRYAQAGGSAIGLTSQLKNQMIQLKSRL